MNDHEIRERRVARVVVIDDRDRTLLFDTHLVYTRVWMTPGGGVKEGESLEAAAVRELWEETGFSGVPLSPCIWTVRFRFPYKDFIYDQHEHYFAVRVPSPDVSAVNRERAELTEIRGHRWWTLNEIAESPLDFRPRNLESLLPAVLAGEYPDAPLLVSVEGCARVV